MSTRGHLARTAALCLCLVAATVVITRASKSEPTLPREPFEALPMSIESFTGRRSANLDDKVLKVLGVEEYLNRVYRSSQNGLPLGLYLGYWASQREGDTIHSPMNCLPGSGWQPVATGRVAVPFAGSGAELNRVVVEKSGERLLVFYWYQSHGRIIASEYVSKIHMVLDAIRTNRTDAAMVRVVVPIPLNDAAAEAAAETEALTFVRALLPLLDRHLPV
jgi:EpsI family protein